MALIPGFRIGPFEIVGLLGEAGIGAVYRARGTQLKRHVAIRLLLPEVAQDYC